LLLICTLQALDPDRDAGLRPVLVLLLYAPVFVVAMAAAQRRAQSNAAPSAVTFVSEDDNEKVEAVKVADEQAGRA
jgi:hypothetical protein